MTLTIATAATGVARTAHYVIPTGQTQPIQTLLLEPQRTNLCIRSEEFDNASWTKTGGVTVPATNATAPDGTTTADTISSDGSGTFRHIYRDCTFTADGEKCVAVYLKQGSAALSGIGIFDRTASLTRHRVTVTWTAGVPSLSTLDGTGTLYPVEALANGWYRILISATGVVAANTNALFIYPAGFAAVAGTVYAWGAQAENAVVPSSYIPTAAATVTRNADSLYFPFTAPPQAMTVYVRGYEQERANAASPSAATLMHIGSATGTTDPRYRITRSSVGAGYITEHDPASATFTNRVGTTAQRGDLIEIRGSLSSGGSPSIGASVNGGAEVTDGPASAQPLGVAWADTRVYINSRGTDSTGQFAFTHVVVAQGEQTMDTMRQLAGVA
jgi:hypothetical protein